MALENKAASGLNLTDIMSMLNTGSDLFKDQTKSRTTTEGKTFDQAQMNTMLQSILEQTGGYSDVGQQAHGVGGYNSSTQALALNDLLTRSAQRVAELNTEKTTTATDVTDAKIGKAGATDLLGLLGGAQLLASGAKGIGGLLGIGGSSGTAAANQGSSVGTLWDAGKSAFGFGDAAAGATTASDTFAITDSAGNLLDLGRTGNAAVDAGSSAAAEGASTWGSTLGNVASGIGYAYQAHQAWQDIEDDNWGGAAGRGIGSVIGGPIGGEIGGFIGTAADKYVLDPINQNVVKPVGHAFDEAITQNVGHAIKSVGKSIKKLFCFVGDTEIVMADGTTKLMRDIALGDVVAIGGKVLMVGKALCDTVVEYRGTKCSASHFVLEDEVWINAGDSELATPVADEPVYPFVTERHVILCFAGFLSGDYAGVEDPEGMTEVEKLLELNTDVYRTDQLLAELDDLLAETVQE